MAPPTDSGVVLKHPLSMTSPRRQIVDPETPGYLRIQTYHDHSFRLNVTAHAGPAFGRLTGDIDSIRRRIETLREIAHVSQAMLAGVLNTSVSTVQKSEADDKTPSGPSLKLFNLIERKGLETLT